MKYRTRTYYMDAQKKLMWERWKEGWILHQIGHLFDRSHYCPEHLFEDRRHSTIGWATPRECSDLGRARRDLSCSDGR